jgi:hypothetical protein
MRKIFYLQCVSLIVELAEEMKLFDVRSVFTVALLTMLGACGGGGEQPAAATAASADSARHSELPSVQTTPAMVDGLAEAYRSDAQRPGTGRAEVQPAYPRVPDSAAMLAVAPQSERFGTGIEQRVERRSSTQ